MKLSNLMYVLGFVSMAMSAGSFTAGKADGGPGDEGGEEKQRSGLFVGFWPPTFFILGKIIEDRENKNQNVLTGE